MGKKPTKKEEVKAEEVKVEEAPKAVEKKEEVKAEEKIEATHDGDKKEAKVAPSLTHGKGPKVNEEIFMLGDEIELEGCKFKIAELSGLKVVLKRTDLK